MIMICKPLKRLAVAGLVTLVPALARAGSYVNFTTYEVPFAIGGVEVGNQVTLSGNNATCSVTNFSLQLSGNYPSTNDTIEIRFYGVTGGATNGYAYTPGPLLFDSGTISLTGLNSAGSILNLPADGATGDLPVGGVTIFGETMVFTVQFSGSDINSNTGTVDLFGPSPSAGANYNEAWVMNDPNVGSPTGWILATNPPGQFPYEIGAEVDATPEPSSQAFFGLAGMAALAFAAFNARRSAAAR